MRSPNNKGDSDHFYWHPDISEVVERMFLGLQRVMQCSHWNVQLNSHQCHEEEEQGVLLPKISAFSHYERQPKVSPATTVTFQSATTATNCKSLSKHPRNPWQLPSSVPRADCISPKCSPLMIKLITMCFLLFPFSSMGCLGREQPQQTSSRRCRSGLHNPLLNSTSPVSPCYLLESPLPAFFSTSTTKLSFCFDEEWEPDMAFLAFSRGNLPLLFPASRRCPTGVVDWMWCSGMWFSRGFLEVG